jgi:type VI secretion system protein VasI
VAQVTPYNENPITAIFDVRGLKKAIEPYNDILHWIE